MRIDLCLMAHQTWLAIETIRTHGPSTSQHVDGTLHVRPQTPATCSCDQDIDHSLLMKLNFVEPFVLMEIIHWNNGA